MLDERIYESYIGILKEEMVSAMGCTEPIALAYGAARAREVLGKEPCLFADTYTFIMEGKR